MAHSPIIAGNHLLPRQRPLVMGIVNVTVDSFSDGGKFLSHQAAIEHALRLIDEGADIVDIGGESTRPGANPIGVAEELDRVLPVIEGLIATGTPLSLDTRKPEVMAAGIKAGVAMVNDVNALRAPGAIEICAAANVAVCLMHMQGEPASMQVRPQYADVVAEVRQFLLTRAAACTGVGIDARRVVIDPGIGFGKSLEHNLALLRAVGEFAGSGFAVMVGVSRKAMFKALLDRATDDRLVPSVVTSVIAAQRGAAILRVHDVRETRDALRIVEALGSI